VIEENAFAVRYATPVGAGDCAVYVLPVTTILASRVHVHVVLLFGGATRFLYTRAAGWCQEKNRAPIVFCCGRSYNPFMGRSKAELRPVKTEARRRLAHVLADTDPGEFATKIGVSREHVMLLVAGKTGPGVGVAFRIEDHTLGYVPARAWTIPAAK